MRELDWNGCWNVRDLGGLPAAGGRAVRRGAVVRADTLEGLTADGWDAAVGHGIRTVVDLRNDDERGPDRARRPPELETVHVPLDGIEDRPFWDAWQSEPGFATPAYYAAHLEHFPERSAAAVAAVAQARPGGVVVHCVGGRDRTGLVTLLLLALIGTPASAIAEDYGVSTERLAARAVALGEADPAPEPAGWLAARGTTAAALIVELAASEPAARLRLGGLSEADVDALAARMLEPRRTPGEARR